MGISRSGQVEGLGTALTENLRQSIDRLGQRDRCIHVGDRESDIFELYCLAKELGTHFVARTCVDRLAGGGAIRFRPK